MKKFALALFTTLVVLLGTFITQKAHATHCAGGQITYAWISDSTYKFTFKFYRDCKGSTVGTSFPLCYYSTCNPGATTINMTQVGSAVPVVIPCPGVQTSCQNPASVNENYEEYIYEATVFNLPRCAEWHFYTYLSARNTSDNLSGQGIFFVEATLNNLAAQGNSSPIFTVRPVPFCCVNVPYTFNNGASDPNNDSLSFELINPRNLPSNSCANPAVTTNPLLAAYNLTNNPFATNNTFSLSNTSGQMAFTAANSGSANTVTVLVKEWRGGVMIGSVIRDIQVRVKAAGCSSQPAVVPQQGSSPGVNFASTPSSACAGTTFTLCTRITSPDTSAWLAVNSNNAAICPGSIMTYTGIGNDTVMACMTWSPTVNDTGLRVITYTVRDTNCLTNGGVASSQTFSVPIFLNPVTRATNDTTVCFGGCAQLGVNGGGNFIWNVLPGGSPVTSLSCTNCQYPIACPTQTTRYTVQSQNTNFCPTSIDTVVVTIAPIPSFNAGPDTTTCINNYIQLNANVALPTGSYTVLWMPATYLSSATIPNPVASPTADITYVIRVTPNGSGAGACAMQDTIKLNVVTGFQLFTPDTAVCLGSTVNVNASGDSRYAYTWTPTVGVSDPAIINPAITPDTSHRYIITAKFPGCRDSVRSFYLDVQPTPAVYAGSDKILCYGDTLHLDEASATPAAYPNYIYSWTPAGNFDDPTRLHPVFTGYSTTTVSLNVSTPAGCNSNDNATYTVIAKDFLTVSADTAICPGDTAQLHVTGNFVSIAWTPTTFINDTLNADPKVWPITSTYYMVTGRDSNACIDTNQVYVTVNPRALITLPDSLTIFPGQSYQLNPGGNCLYFVWSPPGGLSAANIANPVAMPIVNTRYFVNGTTEAGCTVRDSIDVNVSLDSYIDVPNAFSPGSQPNPILKIVHSGLVTVNTFKVYNRWGVQMFSTNDVNEGWNGMMNGVPQPMGVYIYVVDATTPTGRHFYKQGNVTLLR